MCHFFVLINLNDIVWIWLLLNRYTTTRNLFVKWQIDNCLNKLFTYRSKVISTFPVYHVQQWICSSHIFNIRYLGKSISYFCKLTKVALFISLIALICLILTFLMNMLTTPSFHYTWWKRYSLHADLKAHIANKAHWCSWTSEPSCSRCG